MSDDDGFGPVMRGGPALRPDSGDGPEFADPSSGSSEPGKPAVAEAAQGGAARAGVSGAAEAAGAAGAGAAGAGATEAGAAQAGAAQAGAAQAGASEAGAAKSTPAGDGFGPAMRGRARRFGRPAPLPPPTPSPPTPSPPTPSPPSPPARPGRRPPRRPDGRPARPVERGRKGPRRRRGPRRVAATVVLVVLLAVVGGAAGVAAYASSKINREPVDGLSSAPGMRMNVLVVGSDSREGLTDEDVEALGTGRVDGRRPDTIFLLTASGTRAAMLAFPRDLLVTRCDGTRGRINGAFAIGDGRSCLVQTVSALSGIPINHYVEVDFLGFVRIVDAVGGVTIHLDEPIQDRYAGVDFPAGPVHMDGRDALGYVRVRKIDNDLQRIGRQQRFVGTLAKEVASPSTVANVPRFVRTAGAVGEALTADEDLGTFDLLRLGLAGRRMAGGRVPTHTVPATPVSVGGASLLRPDEAAAEGIFARFRDGSVLREDPAPPDA